MAHQWKAGDLAKCVIGDDCPIFPGSSRRLKGAIYRVLDVKAINDVYGRSCVGLRMDRGNPIHPVDGREGFTNAIAFRPILPAEPAFTEAMRSLKPKVEAQPMPLHHLSSDSANRSGLLKEEHR